MKLVKATHGGKMRPSHGLARVAYLLVSQRNARGWYMYIFFFEILKLCFQLIEIQWCHCINLVLFIFHIQNVDLPKIKKKNTIQIETKSHIYLPAMFSLHIMLAITVVRWARWTSLIFVINFPLGFIIAGACIWCIFQCLM